MKQRLLMLFAFLAFVMPAKSDEGMWLLPLIKNQNIEKMQQMGFKINAEDIYSINNSSLKDAIVIFGGGCTGEIISDKGLVLTNHHCGFESIQQHSSVENDYLTDGFWAKTLEEEIPTPGLSVQFLRRIEDVSDRVLNEVSAIEDEKTREHIVDSVRNVIISEASDSGKYEPTVRAMYSGNNYYLFVYERYTDVRFVGAPPSSIGKFGFDTDNWMWPRHTGDFSLFRIYTDSVGRPAKYSKNNIPLKPKRHLNISLKGFEKSDFAMILGFPGSTNRYLTSWGIEERVNAINMARIDVRKIKQDIWMEDMQADPKVRIQYASKYARSSNYYKNSIGMNKGLANLNVVDKKQSLENDFTLWVASDDVRHETYGQTLSLLENGYLQRFKYVKARTFLTETLISGTELFLFARQGERLLQDLESKNNERLKSTISMITNDAEEFFKDYNAATDEKVMAAMLKFYAQNIDKEFHPSIYNYIDKKYKGNYEKYARDLFRKSIFTDETRLKSFLQNPKTKVLKNDPALVDGKSIFSTYRELIDIAETFSSDIDKGNRLFEAGLQQMLTDNTFYPDANFTMRMSYGKVDDYMARDAVHYLHYTTIEGIMEKEDSTNFEFVVPAKLKELYYAKDYGRYADKNGKLIVNFLTNNDITGGNSGSPVLNANGDLFGLAFDGNWEAMSGDIAFEPDLQRTINVDIRYILFIIDKFAGASNLMDEITIVD